MKLLLVLVLTIVSLPVFASLEEILVKPEHADCLAAYQSLSEMKITTSSSCATCSSYVITGKMNQNEVVIIEAHEQRYGYRGGYQNVTNCKVRYIN